MALDDVGIREVDDRCFEAAVENERRVAQQVLVKRIRITDEHDHRILQLASSPAGLLPERGERAREARDDDAVEAADVDAEFQRVGGYDSAQRAGRQAGLDCAPVLGYVPGPVRRHGQLWCVLLDPARDEFSQAPGLHETDRLQSGFRKVGDELLRLDVDGYLRIGQRVPEHEVGTAARRAVVADVDELLAGQLLRQFLRVGNRGRGEEELRVGAVIGADSAEPADELRHVGAEHSAIGVRLVHDAVAEVAVERLPLVVIG